MSTFLGNIEGRLDDKGRIFIPAAYRKILAELDSRHIIMRRDTDNECLIFYPAQVWNQKVSALREALNEWDPDDQLVLMQFMSDAEMLETDNQGRVLLNRRTLEGIGATDGNVLFVGLMDRFALWNPQTFEEKKMGQKDLAEKIRMKMRKI